MLTLANFVDFRAHKLTRLGTRGFSLACIFARALDGLFVRHEIISSLPPGMTTSCRFPPSGHWKAPPVEWRESVWA